MIYNDTIFVNGVNGNLSVLPIGGCLPLTTDFTDLSTSVYGEINDWKWTFGDSLGGTSNDQFPNYTYAEVGIFDVNGASKVVSKETDNYCEFLPPVFSFSKR